MNDVELSQQSMSKVLFCYQFKIFISLLPAVNLNICQFSVFLVLARDHCFQGAGRPAAGSGAVPRLSFP